jgi:hypothetical protein
MALERRLGGVRPKRWLGVLTAALAMTACAGSETGSPTRTVPPGAAFQSIAEAVVRSDDQTIVVNASWGGCQKRPFLAATEATREVTLALVEPPVLMPSDVSCPLFLAMTQLQTTVSSRLGPRHLIDRSTGRTIPTAHEDQLAEVTEIPPGFRCTSIAPGAMVGAANGPPAWRRRGPTQQRTPPWLRSKSSNSRAPRPRGELHRDPRKHAPVTPREG